MTNENEKELVQKFYTQMEEAVNTLMLLRTPEKAYEIVRAIDSLRQAMHWVADGHGLIANIK